MTRGELLTAGTAVREGFARETSLSVTALGAEEMRQMEVWLGSFGRLVEAREVALLDPTGAVLVRWDGPERRANLDALGVLAGASFAALKALAAQLGDETFGGVCHQGSRHLLYVAPLAGDHMLLVLQAPEVRVEAVRRSLARIVPRLNAQLSREKGR